jgi:hypothetical protein
MIVMEVAMRVTETEVTETRKIRSPEKSPESPCFPGKVTG